MECQNPDSVCPSDMGPLSPSMLSETRQDQRAVPTSTKICPPRRQNPAQMRNFASGSEVIFDTFDCVSVPVGVLRGFRNVGERHAYLMAILGGTDVGKVG